MGRPDVQSDLSLPISTVSLWKSGPSKLVLEGGNSIRMSITIIQKIYMSTNGGKYTHSLGVLENQLGFSP